MTTIRSRLIVIFVACFSFTAGLTALDYYNIYALKNKMLLMEQFDDFKDNSLELRRYEKNFFLTGKPIHMEQMLEFLVKTETLFGKLEKDMKEVLSSSEYDDCAKALKAYRHLLDQNVITGGEESPVNEELRSQGKIVTTFSEKLVYKKRSSLNSVLDQIFMLPLVFSSGFIVLVIVVMHMTREDILKPMMKMKAAVENASKGVYQTITDSGHKENEISQCIAAFNIMVTEIDSRQEQLLQSRKMASIGTFTSGIAHELNNPINNISLIVDSLLEDEESMTLDQRKELYNDLMTQADRSSEIVRNLLEFSRVDQGHFEDISIRDMVDKTERLLKNELRYQKINFHKQVKDDLPIVRIDKSRLQQALLNLLLNGIQAMPDGGDLTVTIDSDTVSKDIRIDVRDTGIGIPKKQLDSIFDPFFTTKKEGEGTGLGLSVTYSIIKQHNGRITVESTPGKGTCFSIFLPVKV
ncbi:MAG: HAMP domain-containing sensor histidine kinase [Pseudomonadota bacterium]